ncbi:MAG: M20/M25/M40 family metallo-hydrolase [Bryobacteraceae bacterium]
MVTSAQENSIRLYAEQNRERLVQIIADLVRIPSENTPPKGKELECQVYAAELLNACGWDAKLYGLDEVPGLQEHPLFWPGRCYHNRPNVGARRTGAGGGRSLVLSGHMDTVPAGAQPWTGSPFSGEVVGNRLYGRGSNDMKGGVATNLFVAEAIARLGIELKGELIVESVVDEEFGGVNGTLAGRLAGYSGDAAIISEPSFLRICAGQRGGRVAFITLTAAAGGVLTDGAFPAGVSEQLRHFLNRLPEFAAERRRTAPNHPLYAHHRDPVPVTVTKMFTGPWGMKEPMTVPESCKIELYWQAMPGETQQDIEQEFFDWLEQVVCTAPHLFPERPQVEFPIRWLPGSSIERDSPLVTELAACARDVIGSEPPVVGIEGPCDMYVFHQVTKTPAVLWGAKGGNTHNADEYLDIDSVVHAAQTLLCFVCRWCGMVS